jgi:hypothetical protein
MGQLLVQLFDEFVLGCEKAMAVVVLIIIVWLVGLTHVLDVLDAWAIVHAVAEGRATRRRDRELAVGIPQAMAVRAHCDSRITPRYKTVLVLIIGLMDSLHNVRGILECDFEILMLLPGYLSR